MENVEKTTAMQCGFGKREITPPLGTSMAGYFKTRFSQGVIDPLFVRATLFREGEKRALIMAMDLCGINKAWADRIREKVGKTFDIDPDAILINGSHTHTGPIFQSAPATGTVVDPNYVAFLEEQALCAAGEAVADLAPARLFTAETHAKGISFVRRYLMKDGTYKTNPHPDSADQIDHAIGEASDKVRVLIVRREGADDIYLVNFGTHPDTVGGSYISADWPGYVCSTLEGAIPGSKCMFLLGPQGDVNHFTPFLPKRGRLMSEKHKEDFRERALHARYMGRVIAGSVLTVCDRAEEIGNEGIDFAKEEMLLPSNRITEGIEEARKITERHRAGEPYSDNLTYAQVVESYRRIRMFEAPPFMSYHAYALRIGEFAIVGVPGEPFTELGARIYASSPFKHTMTCCMTNAGCGYVPNSASFDEGGYEMNNCNYVRGADDAYVAAAEKALKALK